MVELDSMTSEQRSKWLQKLVRTIRAMERACLSKDHTPTTIKHVKEVGQFVMKNPNSSLFGNTVRFGKCENLVVNPDYFKIAKISSNGIF